MKSTRQVLQDARDYLARPGYWCKGMTSLQNMETGHVAFCAGGAIAHCCGDTNVKERLAIYGHITGRHDECFEAFAKHIPPAFDCHDATVTSRIIHFNDTTATTVYDVLAVFDAAIAALDQKTDISPLRKLLDVKELEPA